MNALVVESAGVVAAAATLLLFLPQAFTAWKNRKDPEAFAALSTATIWLSFVGAVAWLIYGAGIGAFWTMLPSFVNIPLTLFILHLVHRARQPKSMLKVVGSGFFRLPGERRREEAAFQKAKRTMMLADSVDKRASDV